MGRASRKKWKTRLRAALAPKGAERAERKLWRLLTRWPVVAVVVPVFIGIGVGVMSMSPPEYFVARASFTVAALILALKLASWLILEKPGDLTAESFVVGFLVFGVTGAFWLTSINWVNVKQPRKEPFIHVQLIPPVDEAKDQRGDITGAMVIFINETPNVQRNVSKILKMPPMKAAKSTTWKELR